MQIKHIALATLLAFSLAACGSSNDDPNPNPGTNPDEPSKPEIAGFGDFVADPFKNETVTNIDPEKESSVGSITYIRGEKSTFAKADNDDVKKHQFASTLYSMSLVPALENIVLARAEVKDKNTGEVTKYALFAGSETNRIEGGSLSTVNKTNVKDISKVGAFVILGTDAKEFLSEVGLDLGKKGHELLVEIKGILTEANNGQITLNPDALPEVGNISFGDILNIKPDVFVGDKYGSDEEKKAAAKAKYEAAIKKYEAYVVKVRKEAAKEAQKYVNNKDKKIDLASGHTLFTAFDKHGLISFDTVKGKNTADDDYGLVLKGLDETDFVGEDKIRNESTRIFGHRYGHDVPNTDLDNSWLRAVPYLDINNTVQLGVIPMNLKNVQYGRVTTKIGDLKKTLETATDLKGTPWKLAKIEFAARNHGTDYEKSDLVDTYFYRGVNETSVENMSKLSGTEIKYAGHAIAFGVDHSYKQGTTSSDLPNSFQQGNAPKSQAIGDFVSATYNVKDKTIKGNIYNTWLINDVDKGSKKVLDNVLITFEGGVKGNTANGISNLAYGDKKKGSFRASFYGENAEELGGVVSSTATADKFDKFGWGAVFGAQRLMEDAVIQAPDFDITTGGLNEKD